MAFIDKFNGVEEINVTTSVGRKGSNSPEDVLIVQALLNYVCTGKKYFAGMAIPEPNGFMDRETIELIERFQNFMRYRMRNVVAIDGLIERAHVFSGTGKMRLWTIRSLNTEAMISRISSEASEENYIQDICSRYPAVAYGLDRIPAGMITPSRADIRIPTGALDL